MANDYASELLAERGRRRLSQAELARRAGIYAGTLVDIEAGRVEITAAQFNRFVSLMDAEPAEADEKAVVA
jgi:transcriptional regulator with XRE-family HTH domain